MGFAYLPFKALLITFGGVGDLGRNFVVLCIHVSTFCLLVCLGWCLLVECGGNHFSNMGTYLVNVYLSVVLSGHDYLLTLAFISGFNNHHLLEMEICSAFCSIPCFPGRSHNIVNDPYVMQILTSQEY